MDGYIVSLYIVQTHETLIFYGPRFDAHDYCGIEVLH